MAKRLQSCSCVGNMCDAKLKQMVSVNGLKNAQIRPEHVTNATRIFRPNTDALEDKTARRPPPGVHGMEHKVKNNCASTLQRLSMRL